MLAVASTVVLVTVTAACGGDEQPDASPSPAASSPSDPATPSSSVSSSESSSSSAPSSSDSATEPASTSTPSADPSPPRAPGRLKNNERGRAAFARHVLATWSYAIATNDPEPLLRLSPKGSPCVGCAELADELEQRERQKWHVALPEVEAAAVETAGKKPGPEPVVVLTIDIPQSDAVNDDGTLRGVSPAHRDASFRVRMTPVRRGFELLGFSVST